MQSGAGRAENLVNVQRRFTPSWSCYHMPLTGKVALITGASSGIGQWTTLGLLNMDAQVLAPVRSPERGDQLQRWLAQKRAPAQLQVLTRRPSIARFS
jgi:NAD(P)-dependent dehydrogenase (short-subunit alcohol dehydrogenase family)